MAQVDVLNMAGEVVRQMDLDDSVFGIEPNIAVVHQAVVCQLANARRGTADSKTRGEINASGAKVWRQKGTGRARQGSRRAPQWKGGGVAFGPHPRSYHQDLPRKMRRLALRSVLSSHLAEGQLVVLDRLELAAARTREMVALLGTLGVEGKAMIVLSRMDESVRRSARNIPELLAVVPGTMNLRDLLSRDRVVMTAEAVEAITQWLKVEELEFAVEAETGAQDGGEPTAMAVVPAGEPAAVTGTPAGEPAAERVVPEEGEPESEEAESEK